MLKLTQTYTQKLLRVKPLEISSITGTFASDSDEVHLVAGEFGHAEELGVRQCVLPKSEEIECPANLRVQIPTVATPRASCRVDPYLDNGRIREGHL